MWVNGPMRYDRVVQVIDVYNKRTQKVVIPPTYNTSDIYVSEEIIDAQER